MHTLIWKSIRD